MGGLGPGIGGLEILVIGLVALLVVGPKDLPVLMRRVGQFMARARAMANDFRASFDEMARQSELDELRKEVEALKRAPTALPLGPEAEATFREISADLNAPIDAPSAAPAPAWTPQPAPPAADPPAAPPEEAPAQTAPAKPRKPRTKAASAKAPARKTTPRRAKKVDP